MVINLNLLLLPRIEFLPLGRHVDLPAHRKDEGDINQKDENPAVFHGGLFLFFQGFKVLLAGAETVLEIAHLVAQPFHIFRFIVDINRY